jgi:hypothetical protein
MSSEGQRLRSTLVTLAPNRSRQILVGGAAVAYVLVNAGLIALTLSYLVQLPRPLDWSVWAEIPTRLRDGSLYADDSFFRYSPVAAWLRGAVSTLGYPLFVAAHVAMLAILPLPLAVAVGVSWPFWTDALVGNVFTFVALTAAAALRGSRWASLAYLSMLLLMPRPIMLPVAAWLLWKDRSLRAPFAAIFVLHGALVLSSGLGGDWIATLLSSTGDVDNSWNFGPSRFVGLGWLIVGGPLAVWLTLKGRLAWASLAISPYVLPQYLLVALYDAPPIVADRRRAEMRTEQADELHRRVEPAHRPADSLAAAGLRAFRRRRTRTDR